MQLTIGVDVGNFNTKSKNTNTVSGYSVHDSDQLLAENVLAYKGKYYVESIDDRFNYVEDKTQNEQCFILTLFSIAKEMIFKLEKQISQKGSLRDAIYNCNSINLAIGLPPGHYNKLAKKTIAYYKEKMQGGVEFKYGGYYFRINLARIEAYAQDLSAVMFDKNLTVTNPDTGSPIYYIIGIGGGTTDIIPVNNGMPEVDKCRSLPTGTRPMFETIIARVQSSFGITLTERAVEDVLRNKRNFLKPDVVAEIKRNARVHAREVINRTMQAGCSLDIYPSIFVGGGCLLLKEYLKENELICFSEFVDSPNANASAYEEFFKTKYNLAS